MVYHWNPYQIYGVLVESISILWCSTGILMKFMVCPWNPNQIYGVPRVDLPKIAFVAACGGRRRGVAFSACSGQACCGCLGFDYFRRGALPQKSARSRAARLAQLGEFGKGTRAEILLNFSAFLPGSRVLQLLRFSCFGPGRLPGSSDSVAFFQLL